MRQPRIAVRGRLVSLSHGPRQSRGPFVNIIPVFPIVPATIAAFDAAVDAIEETCIDKGLFVGYNDDKDDVGFDDKEEPAMAVKIIPISDLRRKTSDVVQAVQESSDAVYITQHGRPIVVLVEYARYERLLRELQSATAPGPQGNYTDYLAGLHREIWEGVDTDAYVQQERDTWLTSPTP